MYILFLYVHTTIFLLDIMKTVTASKFRSNLFQYLDLIAQGETILISRNDRIVAKILPENVVPKKIPWQDRINTKFKSLCPQDELIKPLDDIWEEYL